MYAQTIDCPFRATLHTTLPSTHVLVPWFKREDGRYVARRYELVVNSTGCIGHGRECGDVDSLVGPNSGEMVRTPAWPWPGP